MSCCRRRVNKMLNPIVEVHQGKLKGEKCNTVNESVYYTFKKIPYAKPPVDDLRFSVSVLFLIK